MMMQILSHSSTISSCSIPDNKTFFCNNNINNPHKTANSYSESHVTRRYLSLFATATAFSVPVLLSNSSKAATTTTATTPRFSELAESGGVKALDLRIGVGDSPIDGDQVSIHYYGRLAAKQGWRFDSTYDHKDETGEPVPFVFILGSSNVIAGIETAVRSMKVGGIRRVIIPPSQGYQNMDQEPIPPNTKAFHYDFQSDPSCEWRRIYLGDYHI